MIERKVLSASGEFFGASPKSFRKSATTFDFANFRPILLGPLSFLVFLDVSRSSVSEIKKGVKTLGSFLCLPRKDTKTRMSAYLSCKS
jgi:hypothetical protein